MEIQSISCPSCGASGSASGTSNLVVCGHCGHQYVLTQKVYTTDLVMQGMAQAQQMQTQLMQMQQGTRSAYNPFASAYQPPTNSASLREIGLQESTLTALEKAGLANTDSLFAHTPAELKKMGLKRRQIKEIQTALRRHGYPLLRDKSDIDLLIDFLDDI